MGKLEEILVGATRLPKMSAVRFSKEHEQELVKNFGITRQRLRDVAVLVDRQAQRGFVAEKVEEKVKVSKKKVEEKVEKTATVKLKPKEKAKKSSKKKKT